MNQRNFLSGLKISLIIVGVFLLLTFSKKYFESSVKIGEQTWKNGNLDVTTFRNGDPIPEAKTLEEWLDADSRKLPAWCNYENDPKKGQQFGKLYNWHAVNDRRGLAPKGWHIPSKDEWEKLADQLGGTMVAGEAMKSKSEWGEGKGGTNLSDFNALPGGLRGSSQGDRYGRVREATFINHNAGHWWTSTELGGRYSEIYAYSINLWSERQDMQITDGDNKGSGLSVRCIKDSSPNESNERP